MVSCDIRGTSVGPLAPNGTIGEPIDADDNTYKTKGGPTQHVCYQALASGLEIAPRSRSNSLAMNGLEASNILFITEAY